MTERETVNDLTLEEWLAEVDKILAGKLGISNSDLADFDIWSCWDSGMSPYDGAYEAMENDDLPWQEVFEDA
jgi:hypothetical protein